MHKDEIKNVSPHGSNTMLAAAAGNLKFDVRIGNWVAFKKKNKGGYDCTTITQSCFEGNYIEKAFNPGTAYTLISAVILRPCVSDTLTII